jgi:16S rRNA (cytidine1402-2'-O)-methyltransferase
MKSMISEVQSKNETQIWIETPYRNHAMLETICKVTPPTMRLCIGYDLTGVDEFIWTGTIAQWQKKQIHFHKIPAIFLLGQ